MKLIVVLAMVAIGLTPAAATETPSIGHVGRWITDADGKVVIVHGVNMVAKWGGSYPSGIGFGDDDATFLASSGFNVVRVGVERYAAEPQPGHFDDTYIDHIGDTVDMLGRHGILSLIDFHQDEYGPVFHDNGFPAWMTMTDGLPNLYQVGFPEQYFANPALERAYDHFWANDVGPDGRRLQSDDTALLAHVAERIRDRSTLLGYEIINEPWPGSVYPTCITPLGCPLFDRGEFSAYYARAAAAIRAVDPAHLIWYEPLGPFNQGVPTSVTSPPDGPHPNIGFAFHDYCLISGAVNAPTISAVACQPFDSMVMSNALAHVAATGDALLETEFGGSTDPTNAARLADQYDSAMIPWMFWSYDGLLVHTANGQLLPPTPANVDGRLISTLARPYPQLVAGTPVHYGWDPAAKRFVLQYTTARVDRHGSFAPGSVTDVAVPQIQYPHGYAVHVTGATVVSAPNSTVLQVAACAAQHSISVTVTAGSGVSGTTC